MIAYEPRWAISKGDPNNPGENAQIEQIEEVFIAIRAYLNERYSAEIASQMIILYGGSANPSNIKEYLSQPNIDGALIGGASLDTEKFAAMVKITSTL